MRNIKYLLLLSGILLFTCCKKERYQIDRPVIERGEYSPELGIAISKIISGVEYVIEFGHVWDTIPHPADSLEVDCLDNFNENCSKYYNRNIPNDTIEITSIIENLRPNQRYFIQAYAIDSFGNRFISPQQIEYDPSNNPEACFTMNKDECEVGDCFIDFDASCTFPNSTETLYKWDFDGDDIYDEGRRGVPTIHHTYRESNAYSVKLRIVSPTGVVDDTVQIIQTYGVGQTLIPCFTTNKTECDLRNCDIDFDASCALNAVSYRWDFDSDGVVDLSGSDKEVVSHTYNVAGEYVAFLETIGVNGGVDTYTINITVNDIVPIMPVSCFEISRTECELGDCLIYFDASCTVDAAIYRWDFDGNGQYDEISENPITSYEFTVVDTPMTKLEVESIDGLVHSFQQAIIVSDAPPPLACFEVSRSDCEVGDCLIYFDASCSVNVAIYKWDFDGDGEYDEISENPITSYEFAAVGKPMAKLEVESIDGRVSDYNEAITVNESQPIIPESCFEVSRSECEVGDCLIYFDASCSIDATIYKWDFDGDGEYDEISENPITSYEFTFVGTPMTKLEVESIDGNTNYPMNRVITVNEPPPAKFTVTVTKLRCINESDAGQGGEYYGYTTVRLNTNGENQEALPDTPPYENPVPDVSNHYYMWERGSGSTINLSEGKSHFFDESIINYEVSILDINTSQIIVNTFLKEDDFSSANDVIGDETNTSDLSDFIVGETHYIIQDLSGGGSKLELHVNIQRVE